MGMGMGVGMPMNFPWGPGNMNPSMAHSQMDYEELVGILLSHGLSVQDIGARICSCPRCTLMQDDGQNTLCYHCSSPYRGGIEAGLDDSSSSSFSAPASFVRMAPRGHDYANYLRRDY